MKVDTEKRMQKINIQVSTNKEMVIDRLLELVCDIKPEVHQNYRPKVQWQFDI